ncbi:hypothetical protein Tco_0539331 [Tanacetum coccineum]
MNGDPIYPILYRLLILLQIVQIILFIVDSGCMKHMTGNLKLLINFVEKFMDLKVSFRKSTCFARDLHRNDLLIVDLPKPPIDDSDLKPFKESGIRFTVKNGMTSLYFNFKTFCETTGVDYNNGNYVTMPQTNIVKAELIKLGLHNDRNDIETRNVLGGNKSSTDQLPATHPNEGTHTSQLLPEGTPTDPKDSKRNIQLTDMRLPSTMVTNLLGMTSSEVEPDTIPPIESLGDFEALMEDSEDN